MLYYVATKTKAISVMYIGTVAGKKPPTVKFKQKDDRTKQILPQTPFPDGRNRSMSMSTFTSNPLNLAIAYNYFSTHCCEESTKNGLIFTLWSISSHAARLILTSCCDTAFLTPLTILNNIDDKARQDKPPQAAGRIFFFFYSCCNSFSQPWTWI